MYMIVAPIQIKDGYRARFIKEMLEDAKGSVDNEPGCLRFEVIQDGKDPNRIWLVEAYKDAAAHLKKKIQFLREIRFERIFR